MAPQDDRPANLVVTATLTTGVARVAHGLSDADALIDEILTLDHPDWETILWVGDVEFRPSADGQFPDQQMRISARPSTGYAALNHADNTDPELAIANSYNPRRPLPDVYLLFNGETGAVFPRAAAIPIADARQAMREWLRTRQRPTCIHWRPYDPTPSAGR